MIVHLFADLPAASERDERLTTLIEDAKPSEEPISSKSTSALRKGWRGEKVRGSFRLYDNIAKVMPQMA